MVAIPGSCNDIWLVVHSSPADFDKLDDDMDTVFEYKAYHITSNGINHVPVRSKGKVGAWQAHMSVSPDRKRILLSSVKRPLSQLLSKIPGGMEIGAFDPVTGKVDSIVEVESFASNISGEFSPDNKLCYLGVYDSTGEATALAQYNISVLDSVVIANSKLIVSDAVELSGYRLFRDTIYIFPANSTVIGTINKPTLRGSSCDYQPATITLLSGTTHMQMSPPSEVVYPIRPEPIISVQDTLICSNWDKGVTFKPRKIIAGYNYKWSTSSADTSLTVFKQGDYWVKYDDGCRLHVDTFKLRGTNLMPPIVNIDIHKLSTTVTYDSYQWLLNGVPISGAKGSTYTVLEDGEYQVIVGNRYGCKDTSDIYRVSNVGTAVEDIHTLSEQVAVYPNPVADLVYVKTSVNVDIAIASVEGRIVMSQEDAFSFSVRDLAGGIYFLRITDKRGRLIKVVKLAKTE